MLFVGLRQADFKVPGLPLYIVEEAVTKATGNLHTEGAPEKPLC